MNIASWFLWGFIGTVILTTAMAGSQSLGLTRMNMPYLLGSMITPDRDRAKVIGVLLQLALGWLFALLYLAVFHAWGVAGWWRGALIGLGHSLFVLLVAMPLMPGIHPRMASEQHGPSPMRQLEPPGTFALHYGLRTPISVIVSHLVYGAVLGAFYRIS
jgi:uncharacterized membrane protein YagU involved in acid resistance